MLLNEIAIFRVYWFQDNTILTNIYFTSCEWSQDPMEEPASIIIFRRLQVEIFQHAEYSELFSQQFAKRNFKLFFNLFVLFFFA